MTIENIRSNLQNKVNKENKTLKSN